MSILAPENAARYTAQNSRLTPVAFCWFLRRKTLEMRREQRAEQMSNATVHSTAGITVDPMPAENVTTISATRTSPTLRWHGAIPFTV
jgi:hypothetical protein